MRRTPVLRRRRVTALVGLPAVGTVAAYYGQRYSEAICPTSRAVEWSGPGNPHRDFFGCTWYDGYAEGNIWADRAFLGLRAACTILVLVALNAAWHLSATRYYAARERVSPQRSGRRTT